MSDYGATEMSGPLPRLSKAMLAGKTAGDATGTDITGAAAAQWASMGILGDDTAAVAVETQAAAIAPVGAAVPAAAAEVEVVAEAAVLAAAAEAEVVAEAVAQPAQIGEAGAPAEPVAEALSNPASSAGGAAGNLGRQLSGSPGSSR